MGRGQVLDVVGGLPQVAVPWRGDPECSLTQWGDRGQEGTEPPTPSPCSSPTPFFMLLLGGNFIPLTKAARIPKGGQFPSGSLLQGLGADGGHLQRRSRPTVHDSMAGGNCSQIVEDRF